ncbi:serine/threonine protein kinase, FIKK family [Plasmodium gaboni]|uniref:non-specific serine/threonine protein kinase n=2 Tax=Plasmodium gaboni TaxID=647221 RepID=A0A151LLP1_9APIC|nr:serine/threonine protein kinase, FIKK family [Plasmodium gaboni]KYO00009.1 serine/threonine protein kinase, FIKK family [Plasmodium gaboni]
MLILYFYFIILFLIKSNILSELNTYNITLRHLNENNLEGEKNGENFFSRIVNKIHKDKKSKTDITNNTKEIVDKNKLYKKINVCKDISSDEKDDEITNVRKSKKNITEINNSSFLPYCISNNFENGIPYKNKLEEEYMSVDNVFNWELGKESLKKRLGCTDNFHINGVYYKNWILKNLSFRSNNNSYYSPKNVYKGIIPINNNYNVNEINVFIKKIPINKWIDQYEKMELYNGEYITKEENYVTEAVVSAFLTEYHPGISPKFYKLLYERVNYNDNENKKENRSYENDIQDLNLFNDILKEQNENKDIGHIVMITEFFGEDLYSYMNKMCIKGYSILGRKERKKIMLSCLKLINRLHKIGLCHLDISLENMLIKDNYEMRICDFARCTPRYTYNLRHIRNPNGLCLFESCIPTIGKIEYIPPECCELEKIYKENNITEPFSYLKTIIDQEERKKYYFDVTSADKYMLGILFILIWVHHFFWNKADPLLDKEFAEFARVNMDFHKNEKTYHWPDDLKFMIQQLLYSEYRKNLDLNDLINHPWFTRKKCWFLKLFSFGLKYYK